MLLLHVLAVARAGNVIEAERLLAVEYTLYEGTDDAQVSPSMAENSTDFIKAFGSATDAKQCGDLCGAWVNKTDLDQRCESFTWYNSSASKPLQSKCFGHTSRTWFPHGSGIATSGRVLWPCRSTLDCSLNGECATNGSCECGVGWSGLRCGDLDLQPVDRSKMGYRNNRSSTWGAGVAIGGDGLYHMWTCELTHACGIKSWFANSQVAHMVAQAPDGPYIRQTLTLPPFSTNPSMARGPRGEYVMAVATATLNGSARIPSDECTNCTDGSTPPSCKTPRPWFYTNLAIADTPTGPWRFVNVLGHRTWGFNFDLVINEDGSALGVTRLGFVHSTKWDDPAAWANPFNSSFTVPEAQTEDPFVYKRTAADGTQSYHCLYHAFVPKGLQGAGVLNYPGSHAYSVDGKTWYYSGAAYTNLVTYTDGASELLERRERPHLVTDNDSNVVAITNGVIAWDDAGAYGDRSFTLVQPIATA
eukprot:m.142028 g.142028  ORF g.142028 m.142028 type:complete len:474 (+) comp30228_c0_seq1:69-1490(+)